MGTHDEDDVARRRFVEREAAALPLDAGGAVRGWTRDAERLPDIRPARRRARTRPGLQTLAAAKRVPDV